jgi:succinylglutamate desuccinylase
MSKIKVTVTYRKKNGKLATKSNIVKDKAGVVLFINPYVRKGTFVGFTQTPV